MTMVVSLCPLLFIKVVLLFVSPLNMTVPGQTVLGYGGNLSVVGHEANSSQPSGHNDGHTGDPANGHNGRNCPPSAIDYNGFPEPSGSTPHSPSTIHYDGSPEPSGSIPHVETVTDDSSLDGRISPIVEAVMDDASLGDPPGPSSDDSSVSSVENTPRRLRLHDFNPRARLWQSLHLRLNKSSVAWTC